MDLSLKTPKYVKKATMTALIVLCLALLGGCKGKGEQATLEDNYNIVVDELYRVYDERDALLDKVDLLSGIISSYDPDSLAIADYGQNVLLSDGSTAKLVVNGTIDMGKGVEIEGAANVAETHMVSVGNTLDINLTSDNWRFQFIKDGIKLEHADGIAAQVDVIHTVLLYEPEEFYDEYVVPILNRNKAEVIKERDLFLGGMNYGKTVLSSVMVIDGEVIKNWEKAVDKVAKAEAAEEKANKAAEKLEKLQDELLEMQTARATYDEEAKKKEPELDGMVTYTDEELEEKQEAVDKAIENLSSLNEAAEEARNKAPDIDSAERYYIETGFMLGTESTVYYTITYKEADYKSVSETVDNLIKNLYCGGYGIDIS